MWFCSEQVGEKRLWKYKENALRNPIIFAGEEGALGASSLRNCNDRVHQHSVFVRRRAQTISASAITIFDLAASYALSILTPAAT